MHLVTCCRTHQKLGPPIFQSIFYPLAGQQALNMNSNYSEFETQQMYPVILHNMMSPLQFVIVQYR